MFGRVGLAPIHARGESRAPREALLAAKAEAARALDDPCLGFRLAAQASFDDFDVYGAVIVHAPTLGEGIRAGLRYAPVWEQGARVSLEVSGERAVIVYANPLVSDALANAIDAQESVVLLARMIIALCPKLSAPVELTCVGPGPRHPACMDTLRSARLSARFDQPRWTVGVARVDLDSPLASTHPAVAPLLHARLDEQLAELEPTLDLRAQLAVQLRHGLAHGWGQAEVADALGVSPRKLQLDLQALGSSYSQELARVREQVAEQLLRQAELPLKQIAAQLGFASLASFSRFFKRRTGRSPSDYRAGPAS